MDGQQPSDVIAEWNARGVLVLPHFYADTEIDAVLADYRALWNHGRARVTVDDMDLDRRMRLGEVSADARASHRFKVNDLYLEQASVRRLALNDRLVPLLRRLLGERPALCNSLSLECGTEQEGHVDSLFMTPRTPTHLVAVWVALEDCSPESGLLRTGPAATGSSLTSFPTASAISFPGNWARGKSGWASRCGSTDCRANCSRPAKATCSSGTRNCSMAAVPSPNAGAPGAASSSTTFPNPIAGRWAIDL